MGTFGTSLFRDDTALDVREEFLQLLREGREAGEASAELISCWETTIRDSDDGPTFWLALAATQWQYGCLTADVKERAIRTINDDPWIVRWSGEQLDRRLRALLDLKTRLLSPQPKPKRPRRLKSREPVPRIEVPSPDGRGKAVAFRIPGAEFMQVYVEREANGQTGGGSVFIAFCAHDEVNLEWLAGPSMKITYPSGSRVDQKSDHHFYRGEIIPIVYATKG